MKIEDASKSIEDLLSNAEKRSETRLVESLLETLSSLNERTLSEAQLRSIEDALDRILFREGPGGNFKRLKRNRSRFLAFLRDEIALVPADYYSALGAGLGVVFGVVLESVLQSVFDASNATGLGIALGIALGAILGMIKDHEAARQDRVLNTNAST